MTSKIEAMIDLDSSDNSAASQVAIDQIGNDAIEPGVLELEHGRLMELQGSRTDEHLIVEQARLFISKVRPLGLHLENGRDRRHWQGILDYWSIYVYRVAQIDLEADLLPFDPKLAPMLADEQFPYHISKGSANEAQQILGWRRLLDECELDLAGDQLLTIVGEVGSGRRHLLQDLLVPILQAGRGRRPELKGSEEWRYYTVSMGREPIKDLLAAFMNQQERDQQLVIQQAKELKKEPEKLATLLDSGSDTPTMIVIEEFESLPKLSEEERSVVVRALESLLDDVQKRFYLAVTLRRGQTRELSRFGSLKDRLYEGHVLLAFTTAELRHFIEEPAGRVGLVFDPGVIDEILNNIQGEPNALPLLQFTLQRLWKRRVRNRITREALKECGAGTCAIAKAMDSVYQDLSADEQNVLQQMLLEMVNLEPSGHFVPCDISQSDLINICRDRNSVLEIISKLRDQNLVFERTVGGQQLLALTNRELLTAWPRMVDWLDELQLKHRFRLRLKGAAEAWKNRNESKDLLWRGGMLAEADREFSADVSLTTPEREFLNAARDIEVRKRRRIYAFSGLLLVSVFGAVFGFYSFRMEKRLRESEQREYLKEQKRMVAEQNRIAAEQNRIAAEQQIYAEKQQQRGANANDSLVGGDLSGALLWLNARKISPPPSTFDYGDSDSGVGVRNDSVTTILSDTKKEQLLRLQIPKLEFRKAGLNESDKFDDMAVSPDGKYVSTILRKKTTPDDSRSANTRTEYLLEISDVSNVAERHPIQRSSDQGDKAPSGKVIFAKVGEDTYMIADMDDLIYWKVAASHPKDWPQFNLQLPDDQADLQVVAVEANAGLLAVTTRNGNSRSLDIYEMTSESSGLKLSRLPRPVGLGNADVRIASLSSEGDLVVVSASEADEATKLQAWLRSDPVASQSGDPVWTAATLPEWVIKLQESKSPRFVDWGWIPVNNVVDHKYEWQRIGSFVQAVSFSPSGKDFVTASNDGQVLVWSIARTPTTGTLVNPKIETELNLGSAVFDIAFLNNQVLATGGRDRTARIWNLHKGLEVAPRNYHEATVGRLVFARPDRLITGTEGILRTWQSQDYALLESPRFVQQVAVSSETRQVIVTHSKPSDDSATARAMRDLLPTNAIPVEQEAVALTVVSPNGDLIFTASAKNDEGNGSKAGMRQVESFEIRKSSATETPKSISVSPGLYGVPVAAFSSGQECRWLVVAESSGSKADPRVYCCDLRTLSEEAKSANRHLVAVTLPKERVILKESATEENSIGNDATENSNTGLTITQLGATRYKDTDVLAIIGKQRTDIRTAGIVFIGTATTSETSTDPAAWNLKRLETETNDALVGFPHEEEVLCMGFSPNADYLATGDAHNVVKIWKVEALLSSTVPGTDTCIGKPVAQFDHSSNVELLAFSPNGDVLATVSSEGEAAIWSMTNIETTGSKPKSLYKLRHDAKILTISFSPGGEWIITGGLDCSARVWDRSGTLVGIFRHEQPVYNVWMPKEEQILTVSRRYNDEESHLRFWNLATVMDEKEPSKLLIEKLAARHVRDGQLETEVMTTAGFSE